MKRYLCTYFDKNYLLRGLALHHSLLSNINDFNLWILCMDDETYNILQKLNLEKVILIRLSQFEDEELKKIKPKRKISEYCWTCTPSLPLYILKNNPKLDMIAYIDADMYFYSSPDEIYNEFGQNSIMIIPHRFSDDQMFREKTSGIYNVGMLIFRNDTYALECLEWWRNKCLEWCFDYYEDGKLGDQLYLNDWPILFKNVCTLKNHGVDVASWNILRYIVTEDESNIYLQEKSSRIKWSLILYHFHGIDIYNFFRKIKIISRKKLPKESQKIIYGKYEKTLTDMKKLTGQISNLPNLYNLESWSIYIMKRIKNIII